MKIYVASSWRNPYQPGIVEVLRAMGHEVYDFRNPPNGSGGFDWKEIDPAWEEWTNMQFRAALTTDIAQKGFDSDFDGMKWADCCLLILPCGRSAHTEAGWMKGSGKRTYVFSPEHHEPELMYKIYDGIICSVDELHYKFGVELKNVECVKIPYECPICNGFGKMKKVRGVGMVHDPGYEICLTCEGTGTINGQSGHSKEFNSEDIWQSMKDQIDEIQNS